MSLESVREVFKDRIEPYGKATTAIFANGGLMAHHDGVNSAVEAFWSAAENYMGGDDVTQEGRKEIDNMYGNIVNLTINAHTNVESIVGERRYDTLVNAL